MKGMLFGVFDIFHEGHKHFISEAESKCDELTVAVAPDATVEILKGKKPKHTLDERMRALSEWNQALDVIPGDERLGSWKVVRNERPDVIFLGYDQEALKEELSVFNIRIEIIGAHEPERFKSSLL
jgi:cytidyltransferase-like protein